MKLRDISMSFARVAALVLLCLQFTNASANDPELQQGARVYLERCALCHGSKGLGEGPMALLVQDYPDTRLKSNKQPNHVMRQIVEFGNGQDSNNELSPPWRDELAVAEINAVTAFVAVLQSDFESATRLLASVYIPPEKIDGRKIYRARCESCHGEAGQGDGRMSRVIQNPSPADLTRSTLSKQDTIAIISAGGEAMGRSTRMPPWGQELANSELLSIVNYLTSMRTTGVE